VKSDLNLRAAK